MGAADFFLVVAALTLTDFCRWLSFDDVLASEVAWAVIKSPSHHILHSLCFKSE